MNTGLEWASTEMLLEELRRRADQPAASDSTRFYRCAACGEEWRGEVHFCGATVLLTGDTPEMF